MLGRELKDPKFSPDSQRHDHTSSRRENARLFIRLVLAASPSPPHVHRRSRLFDAHRARSVRTRRTTPRPRALTRDRIAAALGAGLRKMTSARNLSNRRGTPTSPSSRGGVSSTSLPSPQRMVMPSANTSARKTNQLGERAATVEEELARLPTRKPEQPRELEVIRSR